MFLRFNSSRRENGFTLMELLVVLVIIGILAAIAIPTYKFQKARAQDAKTISDVRNIAAAANSIIQNDEPLEAITKQNLGFVSSPNVVWGIKGSTAAEGFCIVAYNPMGKKYTDVATALTFDSAAGGLNKTGSACVPGNTPTPGNEPVAVPTPSPTTTEPTTPATTPVTTPPTTEPTTPVTTPPTTPPPTIASGKTWMSGASGVGVANGAFGAWRGAPVDIVTTWSDNSDAAAANFWQFAPNTGEYRNWNGAVDVAVGPFQEGGSWSAAANGAYDANWRQSLTKLKYYRGDKGTTYIRLAHEMNGYWFPWAVTNGDKDNFIKAWKRYRAIQKEVFPEAKLVFSVNKESNGLSMDWRKIVPGYAENNVKAYVDVMSVDYFNQFPYASTLTQFNQQALINDSYGAPIGIERHRQFAQSVGLPLSVSEWSGNADNGSNSAFFIGMKNFFQTNAGTGAGNLTYETIFNVDKDNKRWMVYGTGTRMSGASEYQNQF